MNIALAISSIIKVLVPDRDERDLATCHKIHRVVRLLAGVRQASLYGGGAAAGALGVVGKRGVPCGWSCNSCSCPSLVFLLDMIAPSVINTHTHTHSPKRSDCTCRTPLSINRVVPQLNNS